jgi:hypothetical protein
MNSRHPQGDIIKRHIQFTYSTKKNKMLKINNDSRKDKNKAISDKQLLKYS